MSPTKELNCSDSHSRTSVSASDSTLDDLRTLENMALANLSLDESEAERQLLESPDPPTHYLDSDPSADIVSDENNSAELQNKAKEGNENSKEIESIATPATGQTAINANEPETNSGEGSVSTGKWRIQRPPRTRRPVNQPSSNEPKSRTSSKVNQYVRSMASFRQGNRKVFNKRTFQIKKALAPENDQKPCNTSPAKISDYIPRDLCSGSESSDTRHTDATSISKEMSDGRIYDPDNIIHHPPLAMQDVTPMDSVDADTEPLVPHYDKPTFANVVAPPSPSRILQKKSEVSPQTLPSRKRRGDSSEMETQTEQSEERYLDLRYENHDLKIIPKAHDRQGKIRESLAALVASDQREAILGYFLHIHKKGFFTVYIQYAAWCEMRDLLNASEEFALVALEHVFNSSERSFYLDVEVILREQMPTKRISADWARNLPPHFSGDQRPRPMHPHEIPIKAKEAWRLEQRLEQGRRREPCPTPTMDAPPRKKSRSPALPNPPKDSLPINISLDSTKEESADSCSRHSSETSKRPEPLISQIYSQQLAAQTRQNMQESQKASSERQRNKIFSLIPSREMGGKGHSYRPPTNYRGSARNPHFPAYQMRPPPSRSRDYPYGPASRGVFRPRSQRTLDQQVMPPPRGAKPGAVPICQGRSSGQGRGHGRDRSESPTVENPRPGSIRDRSRHRPSSVTSDPNQRISPHPSQEKIDRKSSSPCQLNQSPLHRDHSKSRGSLDRKNGQSRKRDISKPDRRTASQQRARHGDQQPTEGPSFADPYYRSIGSRVTTNHDPPLSGGYGSPGLLPHQVSIPSLKTPVQEIENNQPQPLIPRAHEHEQRRRRDVESRQVKDVCLIPRTHGYEQKEQNNFVSQQVRDVWMAAQPTSGTIRVTPLVHSMNSFNPATLPPEFEYGLDSKYPPGLHPEDLHVRGNAPYLIQKWIQIRKRCDQYTERQHVFAIDRHKFSALSVDYLASKNKKNQKYFRYNNQYYATATQAHYMDAFRWHGIPASDPRYQAASRDSDPMVLRTLLNEALVDLSGSTCVLPLSEHAYFASAKALESLFRANIPKFQRNRGLWKYLYRTRRLFIIFVDPDPYFGTGTPLGTETNDKDITNREYPGFNWRGYVLMAIRELGRESNWFPDLE